MSDLSKCSDGRAHVLYAIECAGWVEEVGCERCTFKVVGQKAPRLEYCDASTNNGDPCTLRAGHKGSHSL